MSITPAAPPLAFKRVGPAHIMLEKKNNFYNNEWNLVCVN